ncbi:hypothetical protein [Sulfurospirillum diekertiae]|uniref:Uncharacterized protein n=1 Tax=Sulfurospirillum diekertiae TaxID=1854492 RepID=A0A1Y0HLU8_9BACT|nr:hypothetical protein [Sulfurospirillum diekertiae]ARU48315.1 hypothetical protein Sdiek1_1149 [Sulfurospirillum diekertiae]ASC93153.1 hypothetical protein Sdiek2_1132 [Sulfurospirillum diekertiae]
MGGWSGVGGSVKPVVDTQPSTPSTIPSVEVPSGSSTPVNNSNFKPISLPSSKQYAMTSLESALAMAKVPAKYQLAIQLFGQASELLLSYLSTAPEEEKEEIKKKQQEVENLKYTLENKIKLQEDLDRQKEAVTPPVVGETLPAVLKQNTKSLVESVGTLTSTFGSKFDVFNDYMYGLLKYMDIATGFMDKTYTLTKELADNAKKKEEDNTMQVGDSKMSPAEVEARKNLQMLKAYEFKNTPVSNQVLESDSVVGFTPLEIEASHRSFEVEAKVYAKTPTQVKDIDENVLFDMSPREASLVKNAVTAINQTDEKNLELDDYDIDLFSPIDISSIFGYDSSVDIMSEFITRMGGRPT